MTDERKSVQQGGKPLEGDVAVKLLLLAAVHIPLALLMKQSAWIGAVHSLIILAIGVYIALGGHGVKSLACWGAYVAGAEVLWRMTEANLFYEYAKYSLVAVFLSSLVNMRDIRIPWKVTVYLCALVPATFVTLVSYPIGVGREMVSFNMSGPITLAVVCFVFHQARLDGVTIYRMLVWFLIGSVGVLALSGMAVVTAEEIAFGEASNFTASGGFGPNQVSTVLGFGALCGILLYLMTEHRGLRFLAALTGALFCMQSALTFSRTGVYLVSASVLVGALFFWRDALWRVKMQTLAVVGIIVALIAAVPLLVALSHGKIGERFADTDTTGRTEIAMLDLKIWGDAPLVGVGVGEADTHRGEVMDRNVAAHTEFTRLLAEHGLPGVVALVCLVGLGVGNVLSKQGRLRGVAAIFVVWAFLSMGVSAMRIALPAILLGVTTAAWGYSRERSARRQTREIGECSSTDGHAITDTRPASVASAVLPALKASLNTVSPTSSSSSKRRE